MNNMKDNDFGPENITVKHSLVFDKYLSEINYNISQPIVETICKAIIQLQSFNKQSIRLERLRGSTFNTWNIYVNGKNVFCVSESKCEYILHFFDDCNINNWLKELCDLATQHSNEYGRKI